ncbi:hypothetical protein P389DRAFT_211237 [Cystobasidium minutum MCA 4210]|uniref:uncharacterized protein n=1 Tax=Cystobasidium minutum MCA 4210 TaxID=1397322 RepID=UPI0034CE0F56|eukprot:jgi/Rhomi1/211237/estExt_Genemark1.C_4_t20388
MHLTLDDRLRLGLTSGFVSIAFWIVVYVPQIAEIIYLQSGEGLSVLFLCIWLTGDLTGLAGAVVQKLTPTISLLAVYYALCDILMLYLIYYYRMKRRRHPELFDKNGTGSRIIEASERSPLLSSNRYADEDDEDTSIVQKARACIKHNWISILAYTLAAIFIITTGVVAWISTGKHKNVPRQDEGWSTPGQAVGWISAALYLGSRIPQIIKNTETKCQGLSLMMFCFSVLGNITYCGTILLPSTAPQHIWLNLSWLVGSAGTIFLDFFVLGQFVWYRKDRHEHVYIAGGESEISGL